MISRLLLYLGFLSLGGFVGKKFKIDKKTHSRLNKIQNISLLFLLFIMGVKIGVDEKILGSFLTLGLKGIILSVFSIVFSVLGIFLLMKVIGEKRDDFEF